METQILNVPEKRGRDLKSHRIKPWAWFLWIGFDVLLVSYTVKSTYDVWPNLLWLALLGGAAVLVGSLYVAAHSYDLLKSVRSRATLGAAQMTVALIINVLGHGAVSRTHATAEDLRKEQEQDHERTAKVAERQSQDIKDILAAQARLADANAKIEQNAANRADADRRFTRTTGRVRNSVPAPPVPGLSGLGAFKPAQITQVTASPATTSAEWFWYVFGGFALELVVAAAVSTWVKMETLKDLNKNGILDEEEESTSLVPSAPKTTPNWVN